MTYNFTYKSAGWRRITLFFIGGLVLLSSLYFSDSGWLPVAQADNCGTVANPAADRPARSSSNNTIIIEDMNAARQAEGLPILPKPVSYYASLATSNPEALILELFNEERAARGIATFSQNDLVLAQVARNHSRILADYNIFDHNTAVDGTMSNRINSAPGVSGKWSNISEIIAGASAASWHVYGWIYDDNGSSWGHREAIFGCYTHVGIGSVVGGAYGRMSTADFIRSNGSYVPPTSVDTTPPVIASVTGNFSNNGSSADAVVTVNVSDNSSGMRDVVFFKLPNNFGGNTAPKGTLSAPNTYTYTFTNVTAGNFQVAVIAFDKTNNYVRQDVTIVDQPRAPSNLTATALSSSQIKLNWQDNSANETDFLLERSDNGVNFITLTTVGANVTTYTDFALASNTKYYYRVTARLSSSGGAATSNIANATTLQAVPATPANLKVSVISSSQLNLIWNDNATNETGYELQQSPDGTNFSPVAGATNLVSNTASYAATGLTPNTLYYYRVRAFNSAGSSGFSNIASGRTLPLPPTAPSALQAAAFSAVQVNLSWTDNSNNETGFYLEYRPASGVYQALATVAANGLSYSASGLTPSTQYFFRVRAFNSGGNSAFASEVSLTTPAPDAQLVVTLSDDQGAASENTQGSLSFALKNATSGSVISFNVATVNVAQPLRTVPNGVALYGGACGTPGVKLQGGAQATTGLTINGATLFNITLQGFLDRQLTILRAPVAYKNYFFCSKVIQG